MRRWTAGDLLMLLCVIACAIVLWLLATGRVGGQGLEPPTHRELPAAQVEWRETAPGWVAIDQKGNGIIVHIPRKSLTAVANVKKGSPYAEVVYRDKFDLVVIGQGVNEWRIRCPDEKTAIELTKFLTEYKDGER